MSEITIYDAPDVALVASTRVEGGPLDDWVGRQGFSYADPDVAGDGADVPGWDRLRFWDRRLTGCAEDADLLVEGAARVCYMSYNKGRGHAENIANLKAQGHGSVFEHPSFSFAIAGVSRSLTHELARHRVGVAISQLSQRFCGPEHVGFVVPPAFARSRAASAIADELRMANSWEDGERFKSWAEKATAFTGGGDLAGLYEEAKPYERWFHCCSGALGAYKEILAGLEAGMPEAKRKERYEAARSVLPNCTETKLFWTLNARAARHVLAMRGSAAADAEFRRLALAMLPHLKGAAPELFRDVTERDGFIHFEGTP